MSNWISFHELLNRWKIEKFEIVEYLKMGLQPYSKTSGKPIDCPRHLGPIYESAIKTGSEILSEAESFGRELNEYEQLSVRWKEICEKELEDIKKDDPTFVSWKWLDYPGENAEYADEYFNNLFSYLDEAIFNIDNVLKFEEKRKLIAREENSEANYQNVFPCKPGTKWKEIKITLIENELVEIKTPQGKGQFSCHDLGMSDKRTVNRPTILWSLFKLFAQNHGYISSTNDKYVPLLPDTAKRLNKHLQTVFNINERVFTAHYKKEKGYRTKIFFSDQTLAH
jgi:hypothetical protein